MLRRDQRARGCARRAGLSLPLLVARIVAAVATVLALILAAAGVAFVVVSYALLFGLSPVLARVLADIARVLAVIAAVGCVGGERGQQQRGGDQRENDFFHKLAFQIKKQTDI